MERLYWRLAYADDHVEDEPEDGGSILYSSGNPVAIIVTHRQDDNTRKPLVAEPLHELGAIALERGPDDYMRDRGATPYQPIFYRRRYTDAGKEGSVTEMAVFGRARELADEKVDGKLWAISADGSVIECPPYAFDQNAIEHLMRQRVIG